MITSIYDQLRRDEGCVLHAYCDSLGYLTIGVGHLIDERRGGGISASDADMILHEDVKRVRQKLVDHLPWLSHLDGVRQAVFVNMAFQLGVDGLLEFHDTLASAERESWDQVATHMLDSKWARQTPERAQRLAKQIKTGVWQ